MKSNPLILCAVFCGFLTAAAGNDLLESRTGDLPKAKGAYVVADTLASPYAHQAAAADEKFVFAVSSTTVAKYDRATGKELAKSTGKAQHLNSAFLWEGKLYCAHSNYPKKPDESDIRVLDPATMELKIFHAFKEPPGSLTWAVRRDKHWWCHFAHYGKDKGKSLLVRYADGWREDGRWTYPEELVADWGNYSLSGGIWHGDDLLATGHDKKILYRFRVPKDGKVVELIEVISSPFPGQGIASDPKTGGLIGIDRAKRQVVFAQFELPGKLPEQDGKIDIPSELLPKVTPVPQKLRELLKLDPWYQKHTHYKGFPILSSAKVSDAALIEAHWIIQNMLAKRDDLLQAMIKKKARVVVMAPTEMTTDVPEQRNMKPKEYWDKRARGLGGRITSCGEENLLNLKGDRYSKENILVHEFAHCIHGQGLRSVDPTFDKKLRKIYDQAMAKELWKKTYAATNHSEYWAEGVQSYFDCNNPPNAVHNDINTREKLEKYDPDLFQLIDDVFRQPEWRYVRYDKRNPAKKQRN